MIIRQAEEKDMAQIIEICRLNLVGTNINNFSNSDFSNRGFLVTQIDEISINKMLADPSHIVLVAQNEEKIVGYLTACDLEIAREEFAQNFSELFGKKTLYYKQIAKRPGSANIGEKLLNFLCDYAQKSNYKQIVCNIVQAPFFNQKSISFHQKNRFHKIGESLQNKSVGATILGVYLRKI